MSKKYIIGIGDSWTAGEGAYPDEVVQRCNGRVQRYYRNPPPGESEIDIMHYEITGSWVSVLCRDHLKDYTPVNMGIKGLGNFASSQQLNFCDIVDFNNSEGFVIFMLSGLERYDYIQQSIVSRHQKEIDCASHYSTGYYKHRKFQTVLPRLDTSRELEKMYALEIYSEETAAALTMSAMLWAQTFCKAYGFKLLVANSFNDYNVKNHLITHALPLANKFEWNQWMHDQTDYMSMTEKLVKVDNLIKEWRPYCWHPFYYDRPYPSEHLTNCEGAHPTRKGYEVISNEMYNWMINNRYI